MQLDSRNYYASIRTHDRRLSDIEQRFRNYLLEQIGYSAVNNGSFGLLLNLDCSDLDLAIGVPESKLDEVNSTLSMLGSFKAKRQSTMDSVRFVYQFYLDGIEIDLGVLPPRDFDLTVNGMDRCRQSMTHEERVEHVWKKYTLKRMGDWQEYSRYKLEPYEKYFSSLFIFKPIA